MKFNFKLNLSQKLLTGFGIVAVLAIIVGLIGISGIRRTNSTWNNAKNYYFNAVETTSVLEIGLLNARRAEKDFLLNYKQIGIEKAKEKYIEGRFNEAIKICSKSIDQLNEIYTALNNKDELKKIEILEESLAIYDKGMKETVALVEKTGHLDTGLEGELRESIKEVEAKLKAENLVGITASMLQCRRDEKDFLLRGSDKYINKFKTSISILKRKVSGLDNSILRLINDYEAKFITLADSTILYNKKILEFKNDAHNIENIAKEIIEYARKASDIEARNAAAIERPTIITTTLILIIAVIGVVFLGIFLARSISVPAIKMAQAANAISNGDINQEIDVKSSDEIGDMANSFKKMIDYIKGIAGVAEQVAGGILTSNVEPKSGKDILGNAFKKMIGNLKDMIQNILESSDQVAASSDELSKTSQNLSEGAQKQAASLEETSSSMEEMASSVEQVSEKAQNQASSVEEVSASMEQLSNSVKGVYESSQMVKKGAGDSVNQAGEAEISSQNAMEGMKKIQDSSDKIKNIIGVINDIADQTNLLALNASIEAARAGDAGRGFAVVAKEISNLADKSAEATDEIAQLINETGENVVNGSDMVSQLDGAIKKMKESAELAKKYGSEMADATNEQLEGFKQISASIQSVNEMSQGIASSAEEQSSTAEEMGKTIEGVNNLTQQAASSAEEMASSTEELSSQAENLKQVVGQFKI